MVDYLQSRIREKQQESSLIDFRIRQMNKSAQGNIVNPLNASPNSYRGVKSEVHQSLDAHMIKVEKIRLNKFRIHSNM